MKKINMKRSAALLASMMLVGSVVGCSSGGNTATGGSTTQPNTGTTESPAPKEKQVVTVWTINRHDLEYMNKVVEEFNASNEYGIEIDYVVQTDNYLNLLTMAASSGQAPDVFTQVSLKPLAEAGIIQPLNPYITEEFDRINDVNSVKFEGLNTIGEDIYWVPTGMRSGSRFIYNIELFEAAGVEVPKTLDEVVEVAKALTEAGNGDTYGIIFPGMSGPFERWLEHSAAMSGITPYNYETGEFDFTGFKPYLQAVRKMFEDGSVFPGSAAMQIDPARTQFAEGLVGMHANASQEATVLTEQFPAKMEWGVAELPTLTGEVVGAQSSTPNTGWMMSSSTKNADAAWKVIEYFGSEEVLKGYLEGGYTLPISKYMNEVVDKSKVGRMADFGQKEYEAVYPSMPDVAPQGENYRDALWNACLPGGPDIDQTIATLNKTYNEALERALRLGQEKRVIIENYNPLKPNEGKVLYLDN